MGGPKQELEPELADGARVNGGVLRAPPDEAPAGEVSAAGSGQGLPSWTGPAGFSSMPATVPFQNFSLPRNLEKN